MLNLNQFTELSYLSLLKKYSYFSRLMHLLIIYDNLEKHKRSQKETIKNLFLKACQILLI